MKRRLIDDLYEIRRFIKCETYENTRCLYCIDCKNRRICVMLCKLLNSISKYY